MNKSSSIHNISKIIREIFMIYCTDDSSRITGHYTNYSMKSLHYRVTVSAIHYNSYSLTISRLMMEIVLVNYVIT